MSLAVAPARPLHPRRLSLREQYAPEATPSEWAEGCRLAFAELSGLQPIPWSKVRCVEVLHRANRRLVEEFLKRTPYRLCVDDPLRARNVGEATVAALVATALGSRHECWGEFDEALVLVGHTATIAGPQQVTLRRLIELGAIVSIDQVAGWGRGDAPLQVRLWSRPDTLPEPTPSERAAVRRFLAIA